MIEFKFESLSCSLEQLNSSDRLHIKSKSSELIIQFDRPVFPVPPGSKKLKWRVLSGEVKDEISLTLFVERVVRYIRQEYFAKREGQIHPKDM